MSVLIDSGVENELSAPSFWKPLAAIHVLKKFVLQGRPLPGSGKAHLFCLQGSLVPPAYPPEVESRWTLPKALVWERKPP